MFHGDKSFVLQIHLSRKRERDITSLKFMIGQETGVGKEVLTTCCSKRRFAF